MGDDRSVLRGPKTPHWGCGKCGRSANWASRIKCACGAVAPRSIVDKARAADKTAGGAGGGSGGSPQSGPWAAKFEAQAKQIAALTSKLDKLANGGGQSGPRPSGQGQDSGGKTQKDAEADQHRERIEMLTSTIQSLDANQDKALIESLTVKVQDARKLLQGLKPTLTQHTNAGHVLSELERKKSQAQQRKAEQEKAIKTAEAEIAKQNEVITKLDGEIVQAKRNLASTIPDDIFFDCQEEFTGDKEITDMLASEAWKRYTAKLKELGKVVPPTGVAGGSYSDPETADVDDLWDRCQGEKRLLSDTLKAMGSKRPRKG